MLKSNSSIVIELNSLPLLSHNNITVLNQTSHEYTHTHTHIYIWMHDFHDMQHASTSQKLGHEFLTLNFEITRGNLVKHFVGLEKLQFAMYALPCMPFPPA